MLWPFFLSRHARSLNFAHLSFSLRVAFSSLFSLMPGMNAVPDSSRAHPPSRVFPQSLSGFTKWRQSSRINIFRIWIDRSGLGRSVWITGSRHYRNLQFFWPGDRIIVAATMQLHCGIPAGSGDLVLAKLWIYYDGAHLTSMKRVLAVPVRQAAYLGCPARSVLHNSPCSLRTCTGPAYFGLHHTCPHVYQLVVRGHLDPDFLHHVLPL